MSKFDDLTELAGLPLTRDDCAQFCDCWKRLDSEATGKLAINKVPELLSLLKAEVRELGYNDLADEEPIDLRELRLPELPDGKFCKFLLAEEDVPELNSIAVGGGVTPKADAAATVDGADPATQHLVGFGVLAGLPDDNRVVHFNEILCVCCISSVPLGKAR